MSTTRNPYYIEPATISWQNGQPHADVYGDVYFSKDCGLDESRYVFLEHNLLEQRWRDLDPGQRGHFTVIETGFGTGLNFLLCWQLWCAVAPPSWQLRFVSVEKHPLRLDDLKKSHLPWRELQHQSNILQYNYPPLIPGQHRRSFDNDRVQLELLFGDANDMLSQLVDTPHPACRHSVTADAWFLDGFAPAANPDMWQDQIFAAIAALSHNGTSFATFTAAGFVKRGLQSQGFEVKKVAGFGRKREMLCGTLSDIQTSDGEPLPPVAVPWHQPQPQQKIAHVAIIGAGLAGSTTAWALAQRGYRVTVLERNHSAAQEASGNPQGVMYTKLSNAPGQLNQFTLNSFLHASYYYRPWLENKLIEGDLCGILQLPASEKERQQFTALQELLSEQPWLDFLNREQAQRQSGVKVVDGGVYYRDAGWLSPPSVCHAHLQHPNIEVRYQQNVDSLTQHNQQWHLHDASSSTLCSADAVVIANSQSATALSHCQYLPIKSIRGQISYLSEASLSVKPHCVICQKSYLAPPQNGQFTTGASFILNSSDTALNDAEHQYNLNQLDAMSADLVSKDNLQVTGGRAAIRCASTDYLPIVGALPDTENFEQDYSALRKDARSAIATPGRYHPNLYVNIAHGSRGLTSTPICAELIASYIAGEVRPFPRVLCESLSPARFVIRELIRKQR